VVLGAVVEGKPAFLVAATPDVVARGVHAGDIVREIAGVAGGGGGGRPDLAQAGAKDSSRLDAAMEHGRAVATAALSSSAN
jgi:alanyl-tRNA synthetase